MALINVSVPRFPNVPLAPGVPAVLRDFANSQVDNVASRINDALGLQLFGTGDTWGIFDSDGLPVITSDSVKAVEVEAEHVISDYPVEDGGFESYNKVKRPMELQITLLKGGALGDRTQFLQEVRAACESLDLYTLVTPEIPYANINLVRFGFRRTAVEGKTLIAVEIHAREVRVSVDETFSNTAQPSGASPQNSGTVQPQTPSAAISAAVAPALAQIKGLF